MSGTLSLAASIAAMNRAALSHLVAHRRIASPAAVGDPLSLAIELLRTDSVTRALQAAHREQLIALRKPDAPPAMVAELSALGLLGRNETSGEPVRLPEVDAQLGELELAPADDEAPADAPTVADTSTWFGPALTSVRRAAGALRSIATRPIRLGRKGHPTVSALRELADELHFDFEALERLLRVARSAQLLGELHAGGHDLLGTTPASAAWLALDYPARWLALAQAALSSFDARLRQDLLACDGDLGQLVRRLPYDYPLMPAAEQQRLGELARTADELGLTVAGRLSPAASALLAEDHAVASEIAATQIPATVPGVYLQPDLSLIVPGPLNPEDEAELSALTEIEQLGPAASLRLTPAALERAARRGIAPADTLAFLQRLSLTGIPQPLDYLLRDLERKLAETPASTYQRAASSRLGTLAGMARTHGGYELGDDAGGGEDAPAPVDTAAPRSAAESGVETGLNEELTALVDRVLGAAASSGGEGELTRKLQLAIRDRNPVQVTAVAGKDQRVFTLMPVSLQGGRLRATDQQAGVERTLPVSAITVVESV